MKGVTAGLGAIFIALVVYLGVWFFARNVLAGLDFWPEICGYAVVMLIAIIAGASSYRASMARR